MSSARAARRRPNDDDERDDGRGHDGAAPDDGQFTSWCSPMKSPGSGRNPKMNPLAEDDGMTGRDRRTTPS